MGRNIPWGWKEERIVDAGWNDRLSDLEIADHLVRICGVPRSENAVRRKRQAMGITEDSWLVDRAELVRLDAEGLSSAEVAERLGCTQRTVQQLLYLERLRERDAAPS